MMNQKQTAAWPVLRASESKDIKTRREGDLYKTVNTFGRTFELRYGYYEDCDRRYEPDVIYPNFLSEPVYTEEGIPFVTMVQDACEGYKSETKRTADSTCAECKYFKQGEEWFGLCTCPQNKKPTKL